MTSSGRGDAYPLFTILEALAEVLERLSVLTDALTGEKEVSSLALHPILKHVLDNCLAAKPDDDHLVIEIIESQ